VVAALPRIPLVGIERQHKEIGTEIETRVLNVLRSGMYVGGPEVDGFELEFATHCGASFGISTNSGTAALHIALLSLGIGPGDEVITVSHTFVATSEAIVAAGATPVFVDIDPVTYCMDPALIEAAITPRTRALLPVHLYGHPADMDAINAIAKAHDLAVIEDACQAHGATYHGKTCGSFGDIACFSFYPSKNLGSAGEGGIAVTSSPELATRMRQLRDHGQTQRYHHAVLGYNYRLPAIQAAVLRVKLRYLDAWNQRRREFARQYDSLLANVSVGLPSEAPDTTSVYHLYVVRSKDRDGLAEHLNKAGIATGVHYPVPTHLQPPYAAFKGADLPVTDAAADEVLSLPLHAQLQPDEVGYVCEQVAAFAGRR
jgi:dTDP-4-amino-4,6-dideoxygalactose transaminase